jgi:hypothetical protein
MLLKSIERRVVTGWADVQRETTIEQSHIAINGAALNGAVFFQPGKRKTMPADPLFHFRRRKDGELEFSIGRSFSLVLIMLLLVVVVLVSGQSVARDWPSIAWKLLTSSRW